MISEWRFILYPWLYVEMVYAVLSIPDLDIIGVPHVYLEVLRRVTWFAV